LVYHHPFSYFEAPENIEQDPDDPEPADERNIQMEYSFAHFYSPSIGAVTKNYL